MDKQLGDLFDETLAAIYPANEPGAAVIAVRNGETVYRKGFGLANIELGVPIQPDMVFRIGSVTKQFTAAAILMLMEQGKLSLDDPITRFVPDFPVHDAHITVEHLLTHTSGIRNYTDMKEWVPLWRKDMTVPELIDFFKDQPLQFTPGTRWAYSNSGYILLGAIIEKVSGNTYEQFLSENIFKPLKMDQTYYDMPERIIPRRAAGYDKTPDGFANAAFLSMTQPYAAGSLASTVDDLARWDAALYTEILIRMETLARAATTFHLSDGTPTRYGYGWGIGDYQGLGTVEHGGGIHGFVCHTMRFPEQHVYVAVLTNRVAASVSTELVCLKVAGLALDHPYQEPQTFALDVADLRKYAGVYRMEDGDEIVISVDEGKLHAQFGSMRATLTATSPHEFIAPELGLHRVVFSQSALTLQGRVGTGDSARRVDIPTPG